jgi:hypothetical protein
VVSVGRLARTGGLALALIRRGRPLILADNGIATNSLEPPFEFSGAPLGKPSGAVSVLRRAGQVADFLGVDVGTQITQLMAFARPPSFTVRGLHVRREDSHANIGTSYTGPAGLADERPLRGFVSRRVDGPRVR